MPQPSATSLQCDGPSDEGCRHGGWGRHSASPPHVEPAQTDGPDRRQAMHGAHSGARTQAWNRRRNRHARIHAPSHQELLRYRRRARNEHPVFGGGDSGRNRWIGETSVRRARRNVHRDLGRCSVRCRPQRAHRFSSNSGSFSHDRAKACRQSARVRHCGDRRRRTNRTIP